jgi:hypothetical protein
MVASEAILWAQRNGSSQLFQESTKWANGNQVAHVGYRKQENDIAMIQ